MKGGRSACTVEQIITVGSRCRNAKIQFGVIYADDLDEVIDLVQT